jgi:hypothetical protein
MRIGTAREAVMRPAGFHERLQLAAEIVAEKRDDLIDTGSDDGALELFRIAAPGGKAMRNSTQRNHGSPPSF